MPHCIAPSAKAATGLLWASEKAASDYQAVEHHCFGFGGLGFGSGPAGGSGFGFGTGFTFGAEFGFGLGSRTGGTTGGGGTGGTIGFWLCTNFSRLAITRSKFSSPAIVRNAKPKPIILSVSGQFAVVRY